MTNCTSKAIHFSPIKSKKIEVNFNGGDISSNGGVLLLKEVEKRLKLLERAANAIPDERNQSYCEHKILDLIKQRVYGLALGYEDVNDQNSLRKDIAIQTAVGREKDLGSSSTISRLENSVTRKEIVEINKLFVETFIESYKTPPKEIVLDFDATDDLVHGNQEFRHYHGYYREYCYLPLYVFCGEHLLASFLRPSNIDASTHSWAVLSLLVKRIRQEWPDVKIIFRADCGFCRHRMFNWCEKNDVYYIVGLPGNSRLKETTKDLQDKAKNLFEENHEKQKLYTEFYYAAASWKNRRRVIAKAEHNAIGDNLRFIVTNLEDEAKYLYEKVYCARGDIENRIKEQQLDLFADRTSCHKWWANQFRLMLSGLAYTLIVALKNMSLVGSKLVMAQCGSIRLKLFKIGVVIVRNTRRIKFMLSSSYPYQDLFYLISSKLCPE